jgi:integrase/recombinase XerD
VAARIEKHQTSDPRQCVALLEAADGTVRAAGVLITWGGGKAVQVALCCANVTGFEPMDVTLMLPSATSGEWKRVALKGLASGRVDRTPGGLLIVHLLRDRLDRTGWAYGKIARGQGLSVSGMRVGRRLFVPVLEPSARTVVLLERTNAGAADGHLLMNSLGTSFPKGTPVFAESDGGRPGFSFVGLVVADGEAPVHLARVVHAQDLIDSSRAWQGTSRGDDGTGQDPGGGWLAGLSPVVADFLRRCSATGRLSRATLEARRYDLSQLDRWARSTGIALDELTEDKLREYFEYREREGASPLTLVRARSSIVRFLEDVGTRGGRGREAIDALDEIEITSKPKVVLTEAETRRLIGEAAGSSAIRRRDRAMLELLYGTGVKPNELVSIKLSDIDMRRGILHISERRHGAKAIPLGRAAREALKQHVGGSSETTVDGNRLLFVTQSGRAIRYAGVGEIVRRYARNAGISKHVTGSTLRNSVACHLLSRGQSRRGVASFLGLRRGADLEDYSINENRGNELGESA